MKTSVGDPFGESMRPSLRAHLEVLGGAFMIESADASLLQLAVEAFGGLPRQRMARNPQCFRVTFVTTKDCRAWPRNTEPPQPAHSAGGGLLCATIDAANFVVIDVALGRALVCISPAMLRHRYHARYELVELAVLILAARGLGLVPLHAACVGQRGRGALLIGPSGAGKSTLSLHALNAGMQLLSEDSAFVAADSLSIAGVPSFLHVQPSALRFLPNGPLRRRVRGSPMIRRRSGTRKHEVDLRSIGNRIARAPLRLAATVFLSPEPAGRRPLLRELASRTLLTRLRREQPYAAGLSTWRGFEQRIVEVPAYELRRAKHPDIAVRELQQLLAAPGKRP
jgi:hypothetical protein